MIVDIYQESREPQPTELASHTITLVEGDRDYDLPDNLVQIHWPLKNETNGYFITESDDGYLGLFKRQIVPDNYIGRPHSATIRPTDGRLYMDFIPDAQSAGLQYTLLYDKELIMSLADDIFPFNDTIYTVLIDAAVELWRYKQKGRFNEGIYTRRVSQASRLLTKEQPRQKYSPKRHRYSNYSDPFHG